MVEQDERKGGGHEREANAFFFLSVTSWDRQKLELSLQGGDIDINPEAQLEEEELQPVPS